MDDCNKFDSLIFYRDIHRKIARYWQRHLTATEFVLLNMIFDRTLGWGKEWEAISLTQFSDGVTVKNKCYHEGTGLSRPAVSSNLSSLSTKEVIRTQRGDKISHWATYYAINFEWDPSASRKQQAEPCPTLPTQKPKEAPNSANPTQLTPLTPPGEADELPLVNSVNYKRRKEEGTNKRTKTLPDGKVAHAPLSDGEKSEKSIVVAENASRRCKQTKLEAALLNPRPNKDDLWFLWLSAWQDTFPNTPCIAWKKKDCCALWQYSKRWLKSNMPITFGEYLSWCVNMWSAVRFHFFNWMKSAPEFPAVLFFVKHSEKFEDAYIHRQDMTRKACQGTRASMIEQLTSKGMPQELAEEEVDRQLGLTKKLQAIEKATVEMKKQQIALYRTQSMYANKPTPGVPVQRVAPRSKEVPAFKAATGPIEIPDFTSTYEEFMEEKERNHRPAANAGNRG